MLWYKLKLISLIGHLEYERLNKELIILLKNSRIRNLLFFKNEKNK